MILLFKGRVQPYAILLCCVSVCIGTECASRIVFVSPGASEMIGETQMMHLHVSEDAWTDPMTSGSLAVHKQRWGVTYTVAPPLTHMVVRLL